MVSACVSGGPGHREVRIMPFVLEARGADGEEDVRRD
jgi:hypothetical protein